MGVARKLGLAAAVAAMSLGTLALGGCSGGETVEDENAIKLMFIGQIIDTANTTPRPEALAGVRAAVERINKEGGVSGKTLVLLTCDDKADANEAAKCAELAPPVHVNRSRSTMNVRSKTGFQSSN